MGCCKVGGCVIMGYEFCLTGRAPEGESMTIDEYEIQEWENKINFDSLNCRAIIDELLSSCATKVVNSINLKQIFRNLGLPEVFPGYLMRFQEGQGYSLIKLGFAAILLSQGSNEDKLYCLFSLLDRQGHLYITKVDMINALHQFLDLALHTEILQNDYLTSLQKCQKSAISLLTSELCSFDRISQSDLRELLISKSSWHIFSASSIRSWILTDLLPVSDSVPTLTRSRFLQKLSEESTSFPISDPHRFTVHPIESLESSHSHTSAVLPSHIEEEPISSSSSTGGPICLKVNISASQEEFFYFYQSEDPVQKVAIFCEEHHLIEPYKTKLLEAIQIIKSRID